MRRQLNYTLSSNCAPGNVFHTMVYFCYCMTSRFLSQLSVAALRHTYSISKSSYDILSLLNFHTLPIHIPRTGNTRMYCNLRKGDPKNTNSMRIWHDPGTVATTSWSMFYTRIMRWNSYSIADAFDWSYSTRSTISRNLHLSIELFERRLVSSKTFFCRSHLVPIHNQWHIGFRNKHFKPIHSASNH